MGEVINPSEALNTVPTVYTSSPYPLQQELELLQEEGCKAFFEDGGCGLQETHRAAITAKLSLLRDSS